MKPVVMVLFVVLALATPQAQQLSPEARAALEASVAAGRAAEAALAAATPPAPPAPAAPAEVTVAPEGDLQAALNAGPLVIKLAPGVYNGSFRITRAATTLVGNGAELRSTTGPAFYVRPGVNDVYASGFVCASTYQSCIQLGDNAAATQNTLALVPQRITLTGVSVPTHRGKRGIEVNAANVTITHSYIADVWSPALVDSQAIVVLNTPGPVTIQANDLSAGSEVVMVGGDSIKIPGVVPSDILIEGNTLSRPLSWRTDGVKRGVKNLLELKAGVRVTIRNNVLRGHWADAQPGYAIVFTPRNAQVVKDVLFENNDVADVGALFNIIGQDTATVTPEPLTNLVIRKNRFVTNKATFGGNGFLMTIGGNPGAVTIEDNIAITDGNGLLSFYFGSVMVTGGTTVPGGKWQSLKMTGNFVVAGLYGLSLAGNQNGANWDTVIEELDFSSNTVTSRNATESFTKMQSVFPDNTYLPRTEWDALVK